MSQPDKKTLTETNIEEAYNRHLAIATTVKEQYDTELMGICADISPECLEPFASILLQHENTVLNKETVIERTRTKIAQVLSQINEHFYVANDVGKKLITLEVLKEKFAPYEGHHWNVNKLTPEERTRPVRVRLMDSSIRFIEKQLKTQERELEIYMAKSKENRARLQNIQNERVKLSAMMQQQSAEYREMTPKLLEISKKLMGNICD